MTFLIKRSAIAKKSFTLATCFITSILIVVLLYKLSGTPNYYKNGFNRYIPFTLSLAPTFYKDLESSRWYISGSTNYHIYLSNYLLPSRMIISNSNVTDTQHLLIKLPPSKYSLRHFVDSPIIYIFDSEDSVVTTRKVFQKAISSPVSSLKIDSLRFTLGVPLTGSSFIFRSIDTFLKQNVLSKINMVGQPQVINQTSALKKQIDGFFSTDGMLHYDSALNQVVYVYYYRNQFITLDTNLNLLRMNYTIDTTRNAQIKVSNIKSRDLFTLSAPPITINQKSCISKGRLFIKSGLLADNEDRRTFSRSSVIDVYNLENGKYLFSFHILDFSGFKVDDFRVFNKSIVAVQGHYLVNYPIYF
jgi:hypothetical protein